MDPCIGVEGATTREILVTYVEDVLGPSLQPRQVVVIDDSPWTKDLECKARGARRRTSLLAPLVSADLDPIWKRSPPSSKGVVIGEDSSQERKAMVQYAVARASLCAAKKANPS